MKYGVLGPFLIYPDKSHRVRAAKHCSLLAILTVNANKFVSADRLAHELWDGDPPLSAPNLLRQYVSYLRRELPDSGGRELIKTMRGGYLMPLGGGEVDRDEFDRLGQLGQRELAHGRLDAGAEAFAAALALWRGQALADVAQAPSIMAEARRLEERRLAMTEAYLGAELRRGRHASIIGELTGLVTLHPERERMRALLMRALHETGRRAESLAVFREGRKALTETLGIEPGPELQSLHQQILSNHLADQPGHAERKAASLTIRVAPMPGQLPVDVPDLVGRDAELTVIRNELRPVGPRAAASPPVVIVSGKAGVGKSVLAVRASHLMRGDFPDRQIFVPLAEGDCPAIAALKRILCALGVPEEKQPAGFEHRVELFRAVTLNRKILLLLDDAVNEQQVRPLIPPSTNSVVIVTSRSTLAGVEGGRHVACNPLSAGDSLQMLTNIVGEERIEAEPEVARQLAAQCGRLPLALRAAGSMLVSRHHWTLDRALQRLSQGNPLDELNEAELAMRPRLAASYARLTSTTQQVFRGLGRLPRQEFDVARLAEAAGVDPDRTESAIDELIDMHLVDVGRLPGNRAIRYRVDRFVLAFARECC